MADNEDKLFYDITQLASSENPKWVELLKMTQERLEAGDEEKVAKKKKDGLSKQLKEIFVHEEIDGVTLPEGGIVELANGGTAGRWDGNKLFQILTPDQLADVYTPGVDYTFIKSSRSVTRSEKLSKVVDAGLLE
jgi:hypothetical protein